MLHGVKLLFFGCALYGIADSGTNETGLHLLLSGKAVEPRVRLLKVLWQSHRLLALFLSDELVKEVVSLWRRLWLGRRQTAQTTNQRQQHSSYYPHASVFS